MSQKGGRAHTLSDGSIWKAYEIAEETGLTLATIRGRLAWSNDRDKVFCVDANKHKYKTYTLSDGTQWTIKEIMAKAGIPAPTARARVNKSLDVDRVLSPFRNNASRKDSATSKSITTNRMCYDQREHWLLLANIGKQSHVTN